MVCLFNCIMTWLMRRLPSLTRSHEFVFGSSPGTPRSGRQCDESVSHKTPARSTSCALHCLYSGTVQNWRKHSLSVRAFIISRCLLLQVTPRMHGPALRLGAALVAAAVACAVAQPASWVTGTVGFLGYGSVSPGAEGGTESLQWLCSRQLPTLAAAPRAPTPSPSCPTPSSQSYSPTGGACGYGILPDNAAVAAIDSTASPFANGALGGCGICLEVQCNDPSLCASNGPSVVVRVTDGCKSWWVVMHGVAGRAIYGSWICRWNCLQAVMQSPSQYPVF